MHYKQPPKHDYVIRPDENDPVQRKFMEATSVSQQVNYRIYRKKQEHEDELRMRSNKSKE